MIVYKYTDINGCREILKNETFLMKCPLDFNDPFDCELIGDSKEFNKCFDLKMNYELLNFAYEYSLKHKDTNDIGLKILTNEIIAFYKLIKLNVRLTNKYCKSNLIKFFIEIIRKKEKSFDKVFSQFKKEARAELLDMMEGFRNKTIALCLSEINDSLLMWAHYADSHKGACFEIELDDRDAHKVKYTNKRAHIDLYDLYKRSIAAVMLKTNPSINADGEFYILKPFYTKSKDWKYEKELRITGFNDTSNDYVQKIGDKYFIKIGKIKKVYFGARMPEDVCNEMSCIAGSKKIKTVKMVLSKDKYKVKPSRDEKL